MDFRKCAKQLTGVCGVIFTFTTSIIEKKTTETLDSGNRQISGNRLRIYGFPAIVGTGGIGLEILVVCACTYQGPCMRFLVKNA